MSVLSLKKQPKVIRKKPWLHFEEKVMTQALNPKKKMKKLLTYVSWHKKMR